MKSFNKQIQITVELDTIANMLLDTLSPEYKHRENVVEAIIGRMDANNDNKGMTLLYNALNGFDNTINFKPGDVVKCKEDAYERWEAGSESSRREIGTCTVVSVDTHRNDALEVKYWVSDRNDELIEKTKWVSHTKCSMMELAANTYAN